MLDEQARHVALVRAQAALIADSSRAVRRLAVTPGAKLAASPRKRRHGHGQRRSNHLPPRRHTSWRRRGIAAAALTVQVALLVLALTLPGFQVRKVTVVGTHLITTGRRRRRGGVPEQSIFTINGAAIQSRVQALPWVESAVVTTELPATVEISVVERAPMLRIRRDGTDTLVASDGATLPGIDATPAARSGIPVLIDDRAGRRSRLSPVLVQLFSSIAQRFPSVFGCSVAAFLWGADDVVSIWTSTGWRAILGDLDTDAALQALPSQIETLAALKGQLSFVKPSFGYIDLEAAPHRSAVGTPASGGGVRGAPAGRPGDRSHRQAASCGGSADGTADAPPDADPHTGDQRQSDLGHRFNTPPPPASTPTASP